MSYGKKIEIKYMKSIESFLEKGVIEFGNILDTKKCNEIYTQILKTRDWSQKPKKPRRLARPSVTTSPPSTSSPSRTRSTSTPP